MMYENILFLASMNRISIRNLEENCSLKNGTISKWKNEKCCPRVNNLLKVADFFNVSLDDLVKVDLRQIATEAVVGKQE